MFLVSTKWQQGNKREFVVKLVGIIKRIVFIKNVSQKASKMFTV